MQLFLRTAQRDVRVVAISQAIGGEGRICKIVGQSGWSVKQYNEPVPADLESRLQYMIGNPPRTVLKQLAWPEDIVEDGRGAVVGYLQQQFPSKYVSLTAISSPRTRPWWATSSVVRRCAYEAAFLIAELHAHGYLFPDIHGEQFLVANRKPIVLIDAASCQFTDRGTLYPCVRVRDEYQPPELFGANNWGEVAQRRDESTDSWSLAVLLFQLTVGCTPFDGVHVGTGPDLPLHERARQGHFPFDAGCRDYRPPPSALPYRHVSSELRDLFFRCFVEGHRPEDRNRRPSAADWADALRHCPQLVGGPQTVSSNTHRQPSPTVSLPWLPVAVDACRQTVQRALDRVPRLGWAVIFCLVALGATAASYYATSHWPDPVDEPVPQARDDRVDVDRVLERIRDQIAGQH